MIRQATVRFLSLSKLEPVEVEIKVPDNEPYEDEEAAIGAAALAATEKSRGKVKVNASFFIENPYFTEIVWGPISE